MKTRTFKAADGRKVRVRMTEETVMEQELLNMASIIFPILTILIFALAAGVIR